MTKKYKLNAVKFIKLSDIPLSEDGHEEIFQSDMTFGDSCHCLYRAADILKEADFSNEDDKSLFEELEAKYYNPFIDLEN